MFTIFQNEHSIVLKSDTSSLEILPECGAVLNKWEVEIEGNRLNIIDGYDSVEDFNKNCESKGFRSCKLSPYVCRIPENGKYEYGKKEYQIGKFDLNGASLHGLIYNMPFKPAFSEASDDHAMVALQYTYDGWDPGYPFPYFIEVIYYLLKDNTVNISTNIYNEHNSTIPIADGWHPYFNLGRPVDELYLEMASDQMVVFDDRLIPTGALKPEARFEFLQSLEDLELDNCFLLRNPLFGPACSLVNTQDKIALTITPDETYPYLQIYTPPHRKSIAIENLSAAPDAFNNQMGLVLLPSEAQIQLITSYHITPWT